MNKRCVLAQVFVALLITSIYMVVEGISAVTNGVDAITALSGVVFVRGVDRFLFDPITYFVGIVMVSSLKIFIMSLVPCYVIRRVWGNKDES